MKFLTILGEAFFDADVANELTQHSPSEKPTYGYYFTEPIEFRNALWQNPGWSKTIADHGDELPFVFGGAFYKDMKDDNWKGKSVREISLSYGYWSQS